MPPSSATFPSYHGHSTCQTTISSRPRAPAPDRRRRARTTPARSTAPRPPTPTSTRALDRAARQVPPPRRRVRQLPQAHRAGAAGGAPRAARRDMLKGMIDAARRPRPLRARRSRDDRREDGRGGRRRWWRRSSTRRSPATGWRSSTRSDQPFDPSLHEAVMTEPARVQGRGPPRRPRLPGRLPVQRPAAPARARRGEAVERLTP